MTILWRSEAASRAGQPAQRHAGQRLRQDCAAIAPQPPRRGVCCVAAGRVVIEGHWLARQEIWGQWGFVPIRFSADVLAQIKEADYAHLIDCPHLI